MDSAKPGPLRIGDTFLGKYEIRALLGRGGHAFVYEAYDPFLDRAVALKAIKSPQEVGSNLGKRARAEAQVLSRIDHKNLVKVLDAGISDGLVYLIMEKLVGRTLRDVLKDVHRLSPAEALTLGLQVAEGVDMAHRQQVIHRDLKPENVFIEAGNSLKVLDFGIAKVLGIAGHRAETTERDLLQGTVLYMSPEHLQGFGVTPKSDIYALGTILFEALYAHPLTIGDRPAGLQEAAWMQIAKMPPMLDELDPNIPHFVAKLVQRAIVKMPEQRYATMRDFREALSAAITRLREESGKRPSLYVVRDLSAPQVGTTSRPPVSARENARTIPSLTSQVTVPAPYVQQGDTEPVSKLPFSLPANAPPTPLMLATVGGQRPHDDKTPLIFGTVQRPASTPPSRPTSSDKPTIYTGAGMGTAAAMSPGARLGAPPPRSSAPSPRSSAPPSANAVSHLAEQPTRAVSPILAHQAAAVATAAAPGAARSAAAKSTPPGTAPPVSSRLAPPPRVPGPLLRDRGVRSAALAALIVGTLGGVAYGIWLTQPVAARPDPTLAAPAITRPTQSVIIPQEPPTAAAPAPVPSEPPQPAPSTPLTSASATPAHATSASATPAHATSASATPARATSARVTSALATSKPATSSTPAKPTNKATSRTAPSTSDAELQRRLEWLDRDSKPAATPKPAAPPPRETLF